MRMKGFTLVEMLVALAVFALLAAAGVSVMAYATGSQGIAQARPVETGAGVGLAPRRNIGMSSQMTLDFRIGLL